MLKYLFPYFLVVGAPQASIDATALGSAIDISCKPCILDRFPFGDHADCPLPLGVEEYCPPDFSHVSSTPNPPAFHGFVLENGAWGRLYGGSLSFYEPTQAEAQRAGPSTQPPFRSKSIVILSRLPLYPVMNEIVARLHWCVRTSFKSRAPLEKIISNLVLETPCPIPGQVRVAHSLYGSSIMIQPPAPTHLPLAEVDFRLLFQFLEVPDILTVMSCLLTDRQILCVSAQPNHLLVFMEAMRSLMLPFRWPHAYVSSLPQSCAAQAVRSDEPFFVGVQQKFLSAIQVPPQVVRVYLDTKQLMLGSDEPPPTLPEKAESALTKKLLNLRALCMLLADAQSVRRLKSPLSKKSPSPALQAAAAALAAQATPPQQQQQPETVVFGLPLAQVVSNDEQKLASGDRLFVPLIVAKAIEWLRANALDTEGIFRVSPDQRDMDALKASIDRGDPMDFSRVRTPHVVAELLKQFFKDLPEPLLAAGQGAGSKFAEAARIGDGRQRQEALAEAVGNLPEPNYSTLSTLISFLVEVVSRSVGNRMDAHSLGALFGPNLLAADDVGPVATCVEAMINGFGEIFSNAPPRPLRAAARATSPTHVRSHSAVEGSMARGRNTLISHVRSRTDDSAAPASSPARPVGEIALETCFQRDDHVSIEMRSAFLELFVALFGKCKTHITSDGRFAKDAFLQASPKNARAFLDQVCEHQPFQDFIERHARLLTNPSSPRSQVQLQPSRGAASPCGMHPDHSIPLFNLCTLVAKNGVGSLAKFFRGEITTKGKKSAAKSGGARLKDEVLFFDAIETHLVPSPDLSDLVADRWYEYKGFPKLRPELFSIPRLSRLFEHSHGQPPAAQPPPAPIAPIAPAAQPPPAPIAPIAPAAQPPPAPINPSGGGQIPTPHCQGSDLPPAFTVLADVTSHQPQEPISDISGVGLTAPDRRGSGSQQPPKSPQGNTGERPHVPPTRLRPGGEEGGGTSVGERKDQSASPNIPQAGTDPQASQGARAANGSAPTGTPSHSSPENEGVDRSHVSVNTRDAGTSAPQPPPKTLSLQGMLLLPEVGNFKNGGNVSNSAAAFSLSAILSSESPNTTTGFIRPPPPPQLHLPPTKSDWPLVKARALSPEMTHRLEMCSPQQRRRMSSLLERSMSRLVDSSQLDISSSSNFSPSQSRVHEQSFAQNISQLFPSKLESLERMKANISEGAAAFSPAVLTTPDLAPRLIQPPPQPPFHSYGGHPEHFDPPHDERQRQPTVPSPPSPQSRHRQNLSETNRLFATQATSSKPQSRLLSSPDVSSSFVQSYYGDVSGLKRKYLRENI